LHEAEERRKKDEQLRLKKLKASDAEQKRQAEAMARKKEYSEAERQRKVVSEFIIFYSLSETYFGV